jgi:hypothetical protein
LYFGNSGEYSESFSGGTECKPVFDSYVGQPAIENACQSRASTALGHKGIATVKSLNMRLQVTRSNFVSRRRFMKYGCFQAQLLSGVATMLKWLHRVFLFALLETHLDP